MVPPCPVAPKSGPRYVQPVPLGDGATIRQSPKFSFVAGRLTKEAVAFRVVIVIVSLSEVRLGGRTDGLAETF